MKLDDITDKVEDLLDDKRKLVIVIASVIAGIIIIWLLSIIIKNVIIASQKAKEPVLEPWETVAASVPENEIGNGYFVRKNGKFFPAPLIDNKEKLFMNKSSVYITDEKLIPILDISTSDTNFIYKSETLPYNYSLKYLYINKNYSTGIILDSNNVITSFIGTNFDKKYVGWTCNILTPDTLKVENNEVYVIDEKSPMKVAFVKGTLYEEFNISSGFIKGDIYNPLCNGKQFVNLEITKSSYANVILTTEKYLPTGYYLFTNDNNNYLVRLYNSDETITDVVNNDVKRQYDEIIKSNQISQIQTNKKLSLEFLIEKQTWFYPVVYTEDSKTYNDYKIESIGDRIKLDKDYIFELKSTQYYDNERYYLGTVTLTSKERSVSINVALKYDDYITCLDYLDYRINTYVEPDKNDKNKVEYNSIDDLENFKGFNYVENKK